MKSELYVAWTNNCQGAANDKLYVMHAWLDVPGHKNRTLCGARIQEVGDEADVSDIECKKCAKSKKLKDTTNDQPN